MPDQNGAIRTLLVDDSQVFMQAAKAFLRRQRGLTVIGAFPSGEEALAQAEALQPQLVLIDLDMPAQRGLQVIPRLRAMLPGVGIIALTLLWGQACQRAALSAGANASVPKPTLVTDLLPAIRRVVRRNGHPGGGET